jgi:hypothetical protein
MKPVQELFLAMLLKIVTMWIEVGIPLMPQPMDSHHKELSGLMLESLHHHGLDILCCLSLWIATASIEGP